ncbi:uncharacterized protein LOC113332457 [Papaver somniferum]|uniref:uncharacterized protein LOC113332457 n=1 Tax=Papaver somniferum TaxID=3469 RepID=UPI000E702582|nr:uncharacterized protein LOC113332457 [Papaver somniferum]
MDKSWIKMHRNEEAFRKGVKSFLDFAFERIQPGMESIRCPCVYCNNNCYFSRDEVHLHILRHGFTKGYTNWIYHGEAEGREPLGTARIIEDDMPENDDWDELLGVIGESSNSDPANFYRLLEESEKPLYPDCKNYSRLSFTVHLLCIKTRGGLANKWFDELLSLLIKAFPIALIPKNCYEALKSIRDLGLTYQKIDACPNDCILFRKDYSLLDKCPVCHACRWKNDGSLGGNELDISAKRKPKKKVAEKIVRYFSLKARIQRWFMCPKTAPHMIWHKERIDDGLLRHPADSQNWKSFDEMHPTFAAEPRNLRLTLATDGMNPFGNMTNPHSTWPVVLINNNIPPWMCTKDSNFILSMIISGPKSPGNDIDVYY